MGRPTRLGDLAPALGGRLVGPGADEPVRGVSSLEEAGPDQVCYFGNPLYRRYLGSTRALAVICSKELESSAPNLIIVPEAYEAFRKALAIFAPDRSSGFDGVHPAAVMHPSASIGEGVRIGPGTVLDRDVSVGAGTRIGAGCYLGPGVSVGSGCDIHSSVVLEADTSIGDRVVIHPGAVIGADGFGFVPDPAGHRKVPQNGVVRIEHDVEIGANCTIDRAVTGATVVGAFSKLDNLVHLAHNVTLGPGCLLAAQVGIAGSTRVGAGVVMGGQAGLGGHLEIGERATIAGQAGVTKNVPPGAVVSGYPARMHAKALRQDAALARLTDLVDSISEHLNASRIEKEKPPIEPEPGDS